MSMCLWVRAMDTYATVYRIVEPKRKMLAAAQVSNSCAVSLLGSSRIHDTSCHHWRY